MAETRDPRETRQCRHGALRKSLLHQHPALIGIVRFEERSEAVQARRVRDVDAGLEALVRRVPVAELQRRDAEQRERVTIALGGAGNQLWVIDDLEWGAQRGLLDGAVVTHVSFRTST